MSQTLSMPSAAMTPAWGQHAAWLARLWRLSPLTLLLHRDNAQADVLMQTGLLPLTARRGIDRHGVEVAMPPTVSTTRSADARQRLPERVLQVHALRSRDPLARLRHRLQALLPPAALQGLAAVPSLVELARAAQRHGVGRLLLVVRQLDDLLAPRNDDPGPRQALCDALVALLSTPGLTVNVLLVVNEDADALLNGLRRALPHLDDHRLRVGDGASTLQPATRAQPDASDGDFRRSLDALLLRVAHFEGPVRRSTPTSSPQAAAEATPVPEPDLEAAPLGAQHVPSESTTAAVPATATATAPAPAPAPAPGPGPGPAAVPVPVPGLSVTLSTPTPPKPLTPPTPSARRLPKRALAGAALGLACVFTLGWLLLPPGLNWTSSTSSPTSASATTPPPMASTAAPPATAPLPATKSVAAPTTAAAELRTALAGTGLPWVHATGDADWAAAVRGLAKAPGLALMRYDELQAARRWPQAPALQVLAPMYLDPVLFLVRDDSPWRFLHEISSARVNLGPADGARALAARSVWQGLFSRDLPTAQADAGRAMQALEALRAGRVDAVAWVGALPTASTGLRLLAPDRDHPSTARLQRRFLIAPQPDAAPGLALMNFLVSSAQTPAQAQRDAARSLCAALPRLRTAGQPVWQAVQPVPPLPTGWPTAQPAVEEFDRCAAAASVPGRRVSQQATTIRSAS
jgi:hypothetical protein